MRWPGCLVARAVCAVVVVGNQEVGDKAIGRKRNRASVTASAVGPGADSICQQRYEDVSVASASEVVCTEGSAPVDKQEGCTDSVCAMLMDKSLEQGVVVVVGRVYGYRWHGYLSCMQEFRGNPSMHLPDRWLTYRSVKAVRTVNKVTKLAGKR